MAGEKLEVVIEKEGDVTDVTDDQISVNMTASGQSLSGLSVGPVDINISH